MRLQRGALILWAWLLALHGLTAHAQNANDTALVVGIKAAPPFVLSDAQQQWQGASVDLWQQIASSQGWQTRWQEFASADAMIEALAAGSIDVAVGALSMTAEREAVMDFSHPYFTTGLGIATPVREQGILSSLAPLASWEFIRAVGLLFALLLAVGAVLWLLERRRNPAQFGGSTSAGIGNGLWWSAVTMTTVGYGDKAPVTLPGRIVATVWMFVSVITISSFTAAIASSVTVNQIATSVNGIDDLSKVRSLAVAGSTGEQALRARGFGVTSVSSAQAGIDALMNGAPAMVYDKAIMMYLLREDNGTVNILDFPGTPQKYALGMRPDFPHREAVNHALLEVTGGDYWQGQLRRYFGDRSGQ